MDKIQCVNTNNKRGIIMKSTIILASNNEKSFSKEIVNKLIDILTQNMK